MTTPAFKENVTILTGASRGIGRQVAYKLAEQGAWLVLAARTAEKLEEVAEECRNLGGRSIVVPTDVAQRDQCERLIARTVEQYGRVDTLINNAGITMWSRFDQLQDLAPVERVMQVNYFGSLYCTYAALPYLKESRGRIVVVASLAGKSGIPNRSAYAASKHALVGFFETLRIELAPLGVSVTIIYPDFVATDTRRRAFGPDGKPLGESPVRENKVMTAEECARIIVAAAASRKRDEITSLRGKLGLWLKLVAPALVDRIASRAIERGR